MDAPVQISTTQQQKDTDHLKLLAIFHFIFAGLCLLGIGFLFLHYSLMRAVFSNPQMWKNQKNPPPFDPKEFVEIFMWVYVFLAFILIIVAILNALSARFLQQRKCRTFSLVIAGLNCLQIPFGTTLGIFTFVILLRDSVRSIFKD